MTAVLALLLAAADKPVVMVSYFDNETNKPELEVMKKGLADLIITDLVGYEGITVVERARLEGVMAELKLQHTAAFDPATRLKLGKLVSAKYLIHGSIVGLLPEVRLNAMITELQTGKELASTSVQGTPEHLFDLEQELVGKLTAAIDAKVTNRGQARKMKGVDVETVLAYSKGLDLEDQGKLEEARKQYAEVLKKKPAFMLPRDRTEALIKAMQQSESTRAVELSGDLQKLAQAIDEGLKPDFAGLGEEEQRTYLGFRVLRGRLLGRALKEHLTSHEKYLRLVKHGHEAQVLKGMRELAANLEAARSQLDQFKKLRTKYVNQIAILSTSVRLPPELDRIIREQKLGSVSIDRLGFELRDVILFGKINEGEDHYLIGPALGDLDPKLQAETFAALERDVDALLAADKVKNEWQVKESLEQHALALFRLGKTEEGIARLQRFLDAYPTSTAFAQVTRLIKIELGVEYDNTHEELINYPDKGLKECDYFALYKGFGPIEDRRMKLKGIAGLTETIAEAEKACGGHKVKNLTSGWRNFYSSFALTAARYEECELAKELFGKYLAEGGPRSDLEGYQKNHIPWCNVLP